jgi:hypothetical protein
MPRTQDVIKAMTEGDFSRVEAFSTRSGTRYQVFLPQIGEARPSGVSIAPRIAEMSSRGLLVTGAIYGRSGQGQRPDGSPLLPEGVEQTTTAVQKVELRTRDLAALLKLPPREILKSIHSLTSQRGTVYTFVRSPFEAFGTTERKFLPESIVPYDDGTLLVRGRVWGDDRYGRGETVTLCNIGSLTLTNGRSINVRQRVDLSPAPTRTGYSPVMS